MKVSWFRLLPSISPPLQPLPPCKSLSAQFGPSGSKALAVSFLPRPPSDSGPGRGSAVPALEPLNRRKKEAFVTGSAALGSETETDCARKQTTEKKKKGSTTEFFETSVISLSLVLKRQISFLRGNSISEVVRFQFCAEPGVGPSRTSRGPTRPPAFQPGSQRPHGALRGWQRAEFHTCSVRERRSDGRSPQGQVTEALARSVRTFIALHSTGERPRGASIVGRRQVAVSDLPRATLRPCLPAQAPRPKCPLTQRGPWEQAAVGPEPSPQQRALSPLSASCCPGPSVLPRLWVNIPSSCSNGQGRAHVTDAGEWARREDGERVEGREAAPGPQVGGPGTRATPGSRSALQTRTQISGSGPHSREPWIWKESREKVGDHHSISMSLLEGEECFLSPRPSRLGEKYHFHNVLWFAADKSSTSWV